MSFQVLERLLNFAARPLIVCSRRRNQASMVNVTGFNDGSSFGE
jgi:hypothetical protein